MELLRYTTDDDPIGVEICWVNKRLDYVSI